MLPNSRFPNRLPEGDREACAAWLALLTYDAMLVAERPSLENGWLASLVPSAAVVRHTASGELLLALRHATFAFIGLELAVTHHLYALRRPLVFRVRFVWDLAAWQGIYTTVLSPRLCEAQGVPERSRLVWRHNGADTLLRFSLRSCVSLTVPEILDILVMLGKAAPNPPRKADCLQALVNAAFPEWTDVERQALLDALIKEPSREASAEADLDEDVLAAIKALPEDQRHDFADYIEAADRVERRHRLKRRQAAGEAGVGRARAQYRPHVAIYDMFVSPKHIGSACGLRRSCAGNLNSTAYVLGPTN